MTPNERLIELFEERAAIMEFCGCMTRADADWEAYLEVKKLVGRKPDGSAVALPKEITDKVRQSKQTFLF